MFLPARQHVLQRFIGFRGSYRWISSQAPIDRKQEYEAKYAEKLVERAKRDGLSLEELKEKTRKNTQQKVEKIEPIKPDLSSKPNLAKSKLPPQQPRKDSSPIKPLTEIMDIHKILQMNHTKDDISKLWTAYHATRSQGTGRGYLSAMIPSETYQKMIQVAAKYPVFFLPLERPSPEHDQEVAHEFFFMQWDFYDPPPHPLLTPGTPFDEQLPGPPPSATPNPQPVTVLFTTLQEYKLRQTFALPYLVLTFYTDLATTHDIVLMRGELTASPTSSEKYLLSQEDAQKLGVNLQRFYLPEDGDKYAERAELLKSFHEKPVTFEWEKLLSVAKLGV